MVLSFRTTFTLRKLPLMDIPPAAYIALKAVARDGNVYVPGE